MIDARDLRIGNLLNKDGIVVTIDARSIFDIWEKSDKYIPIPLSDVWLTKFGFLKHDDYYELLINGKRVIQVNYITVKPHLWLKDSHGTIHEEYVFISHPKFIHQLQNLYFSLTGEELQIKK